MNRELLADIAHALRDLDGFLGVTHSAAQAVVIVSGPIPAAHAAARLTALPPALVDIRFDPTRLPAAITLSEDELARAARRDHANRDVRSRRALEIETTTTRTGRFASNVLVVSASASQHAMLLRSIAGMPLTTYATSSIATAAEVVAVGAAPFFVLLDRDMPETLDFEKTLGAKVVHWLSTEKGFGFDDAVRVLHAIGIEPADVVDQELAKLRILVVDTEDAGLAREVEVAAPTASVSSATGWEALERLDQNAIDLVVAGEVRDVSLSTLVRCVARCKAPPLLVIASHETRIARLRASHPALAHYFVARPLGAGDLFRVLRQ